MTTRTLVVAGHGMVGHRLVEEMLTHDRHGRWRVVVLGEEPRAAYDRVALSSLLDGATHHEDAGALAHHRRRRRDGGAAKREHTPVRVLAHPWTVAVTHDVTARGGHRRRVPRMAVRPRDHVVLRASDQPTGHRIACIR